MKKIVWIAITVPVAEDKPNRFDNALREACRLESAGALLVCDRRASQTTMTLAQQAFDRWQPLYKAVGRQLVLFWVSERETTHRWERAFLEAFTNPAADGVFLFPMDWDMPSEGENATKSCDRSLVDWQRAWESMIVAAEDGAALVVGDYRPRPGTFKAQFADLVGLPVLEAYFPAETAQIRELGLEQVRTEWLYVSRDGFQSVGRDFVAWTFDASADLIVTCLRNKLPVRRLWLGDWWDDARQRENPMAPLYQMVRYEAGLRVNRTRVDRNRYKDHDAATASYAEFERCMADAQRVLADALTRWRHAGGSQ